MLTKITLLTTFVFTLIYPLCFLISADQPLKNNFHRFHLGLPNVVGGIFLVFILLMPLPLWIKLSIAGWLLFSFIVSYIEWRRETPRPVLLIISFIIGLIVFCYFHHFLIGKDAYSIISWLLGGLIFSSSLYAMNLGHWYLNVHGLPIVHLRRATQVFAGCLIARFLWDVFIVLTQQVLYRGELIAISSFLFKMDGFLLSVAFFFGILFPLFSVYFALETIKLKNTQSTTGILYAILCGVLLGDFAYKYYLMQYNLPL